MTFDQVWRTAFLTAYQSAWSVELFLVKIIHEDTYKHTAHVRQLAVENIYATWYNEIMLSQQMLENYPGTTNCSSLQRSHLFFLWWSVFYSSLCQNPFLFTYFVFPSHLRFSCNTSTTNSQCKTLWRYINVCIKNSNTIACGLFLEPN